MFPTHPVYQNSLTPEALALFNAHDIDGLKKLLEDLIAEFDFNCPDFHGDLGVLLCTAGLLESLMGGKACMVLCDFVNF